MPPSASDATSLAAAAPTDTARLWRWWWLLLGLTLLWDLGGADLAVMQAIGTPGGFPLRDQWLLSHVLHDRVRQFSSYFYLLCGSGPPGRTAGPWAPPRCGPCHGASA